MKILVTGAAGFIGFHLVIRLLDEGHKVIGLDNINDYYDVNLKYARLQECGIKREEIESERYVNSKKFNAYSFIKLNLEDEKGIERVFNKHQFDIVCNLAAQAGVRYSLENPRTYIQSNIVGFMNILEGCRQSNVKHLVYASSSSVYGMNTKVPFSVEDRVDNPVSLYAATKKSNELMAHTYSHLYKLRTTGLRFFTVYGPWGRPDMAPMLFAKAILKGEPIKVFNNGNLERDFTYIEDIIEGVLKVINYNGKNESKLYKLYNIGNGKPVKLMNFITVLEEELSKLSIKEYLPMQLGDVYKTWANCHNLQNDFDYKPTWSIKNGVMSFVKWYIEYNKSFKL